LFEIDLRIPTAEDGASVYQLVHHCPPLDTNSMYCNLLQCTHFASTSVAAVSQDELLGFISGYLMPDRPDTLFIWQVAVAEKARGQGVSTRMLKAILSRSQCTQVKYLETTITDSNKASWALFEGLANKLNTQIKTSVMFDKDKHLNGEHDSENLLRLGPLTSLAAPSNQEKIS